MRIAVLWVLAIVPQAFGFWLVAGDVAGVAAGQRRTFLLAGLLTLALATLAQVAFGYRLALYEGPAAGYLASVIVVASGGHDLAEITGGMLVAGVTVIVLGLARFDRLLLRVFTPLTGMVFVLVVTVAVMPTTLERAIGVAPDAPRGTSTGWITAAATLAVALVLQRRRALRPTRCSARCWRGRAPRSSSPGCRTPISAAASRRRRCCRGEPRCSIPPSRSPFVIGALIVAFNTVAAVEIASDATAAPASPRRSSRALAVHGGAQVGGALLGNVLGTVGRLDSLPIAGLLGTHRRRPLAIAALMIFALAFVGPFLGLVAALPLQVSATLLAFMLGTMIVTTGRRLWPLGRRRASSPPRRSSPPSRGRRCRDSLSATAQLLGQPDAVGGRDRR